MFFTCITNFKPRAGEPGKYRNIFRMYYFIFKNKVLPLLSLAMNQYPSSLQGCLSGRLGLSTMEQFLSRVFITREILEQNIPQQGTGSTLASKPASGDTSAITVCVFLIKEAIAALDFKVNYPAPCESPRADSITLLGPEDLEPESAFSTPALFQPHQPPDSSSRVYISGTWVKGQ